MKPKYDDPHENYLYHRKEQHLTTALRVPPIVLHKVPESRPKLHLKRCYKHAYDLTGRVDQYTFALEIIEKLKLQLNILSAIVPKQEFTFALDGDARYEDEVPAPYT